MKCKYCQEELEEGSTVCPSCGKDNDESVREPEKPEKKKISSGALAAIYGVILVVLAVLVGIVLYHLNDDGIQEQPSAQPGVTEGTIPEDSNQDDVTCKGSYTVSDKKAKSKKNKNKVVATIGDLELTNAELQTYFWMQVYNFQKSGNTGAVIDYQKPLDTQICNLSDENITWQQFFLKSALRTWQTNYVYCMEAEEDEFVYEKEMLEFLEAQPEKLKELAQKNELSGPEEIIAHDMGPGSSVEGYLNYVSSYYKGAAYYNDLYQKYEPDEEEIRKYYEENAEQFKEQGIEDDGASLIDVRHILVEVEKGADQKAWDKAKQDAQKIYDEWLAGECTEDSFAALAEKHTQDPGSKQTGGLYEKVYKGQMVPPFDEWCFAKGRKTGDHGIVKTDFGYHIMFFSDSTPLWYLYSSEGARSKGLSEKTDKLLEQFPMTVSYEDIVIGLPQK